MKTPRTRIASTIAAQTYGDGKINPAYAKKVAAYLLSEGRAKELDSLLRDVQADWAQRGYVEVIVRTAHELESSAKNDIVARLQQLYPKANEIAVTEVLDPSVLGGVQISLADKQLDLSVEAKLNKFKQLTTAGKE